MSHVHLCVDSSGMDVRTEGGRDEGVDRFYLWTPSLDHMQHTDVFFVARLHLMPFTTGLHFTWLLLPQSSFVTSRGCSSIFKTCFHRRAHERVRRVSD